MPSFLVLLTPNLDFGSITQGQQTTLTCQIANYGDEDATISSVDVATPYAFDNVVLPLLVPAHNNASFGITFVAGTPGTTPASAAIVTSDDAGSPIAVPLSSTSVAAGVRAISVNPSSQAFEDTKVGQNSTIVVFTITNTSTVSVSITGVTFPTGFAAAVPTNTYPQTITAGNTLTFGATFTPVGQGLATGNTSIASNAPSSPTLIAVTGNGFLITPAYIASGAEELIFAFGDGTWWSMDDTDFECETDAYCSNTVMLPFQTPEGSIPGFAYEKQVCRVQFHYENLGVAEITITCTTENGHTESENVTIGTIGADGKVYLGIADIIVVDEIVTITFTKVSGPLSLVDWVARYEMKGEKQKDGDA